MYKFNPKLCDNMREEHVSLSNVEASDLFQEIKKYLEDLKLDIIHEEKLKRSSGYLESRETDCIYN